MDFIVVITEINICILKAYDYMAQYTLKWSLSYFILYHSDLCHPYISGVAFMRIHQLYTIFISVVYIEHLTAHI